MKNIVVLAIWGAPASTITLKALSRVPNIKLFPVYEKNEKIAKDIARIYAERFGDKAPLFEDPAHFLPNSPALLVEGLSRHETLETIRQLAPDYIALAGSGIVKEDLLKIPKHGTVNAHPGILPRYRGCTCVEWALYEDEVVGSTCHFVTKEIDAGDIIKKETFPIYKNESYTELRLRSLSFTAELLAKSIDSLVNQESKTKQAVETFDWSKAQYYKPIPEKEMKEVMAKLEQGTYKYTKARS